MGGDTAHEPGRGPGALAYLPAIGAAALFAALLPAIGPVSSGEVLRGGVDWVPSLGVRLSGVLDGLSLTFALLITGIGALVMLFAARYLAGHVHAGRFGLYLFSFMLAMLGLVVADNLLALFVFWELTSITSYLLIGFGHADPKARRSALQALLVTGMGGLALLAGFILIYTVVGSFDLEVVLASGDALRASPLYIPILVLVLAGAFTKSAQFPLHFWLPNAMAAPTPVSAYLHSATMVKAGVFLLARLHPALSGTEAWLWSLTVAGGVTAVFASLMALKQTDLKQALAYTTLMALGTLVLFLADATPYAITGFMAFLVTHSLYKAALFLVVGTVDHGTGTRDARVLGGLARAMPVTAVAAALAGLSMAGLPPFVGFIAKEVLYKGAGEVTLGTFVTAAALAANALMFAVAGIVALRPFWGRARGETPVTPHEGPWQMLVGPVLLAALGLVFGLMPWLKQSILVSPGVDAVLGRGGEARDLKLWAGVNVALVLSLVTFALGIAIYAGHVRLRGGLQRLGDALPSFDAGWDRFLDGVKALAGWQTRILQSGRLTNYMATTFATLFVALAGTLILRAPAGLGFDAAVLGQLMVKEWAIAVLIFAGTAVVTVTNSRITAIAGLGVVGVGVALVFITYGAPDVAITQLLVEVLVVVLVALAILKLPLLTPERNRRRLFDAALALGIGGLVAAVTLMVVSTPVDRRLSSWFEVTAWPEAYGRNIVNVILVDFRALDTFGEIAVVAVAALAALALLRARPGTLPLRLSDMARGKGDSR